MFYRLQMELPVFSVEQCFSCGTAPPIFTRENGGLRTETCLPFEYSASLDCDFKEDFCTQWENDGKWEYGVTPNNDLFELPEFIEGNVAVAVLDGANSATLTSRLVPCANNATITVTYYRSKHAQLRICIDERCTVAENASGQSVLLFHRFWLYVIVEGRLSIAFNSRRLFYVKIVVESSVSAVAIIRRVETRGHVCPLLTPNQLACNLLKCNFDQRFCAYTSERVRCVIDRKAGRAILRSPHFRLTTPIDLEITLYQPTFGSQTFICGDGHESLDRCHLLLGPKIEVPKVRPVRFRLDPDMQQFALVAFHDKSLQFGAATFIVSSIRVFDEREDPVC
ncbi:unnamed protein product [Toxocara canis]|uniref:MAM domain-containing protein n=1 Tax=Toxocara canis TaxID=6265 RepID=A0A183TXY8_TOXCA|nr:unnamed protein product [Toxocara canis]